MHPKTYQVRLRQPFEFTASMGYHLHVHADSRLEALAWVGRVFEGVDVEAVMRKWKEPAPAVPRVGCSDAVTIIDCDRFTTRKRVAGGWVTQAVEPGQFRRSPEEVTQDLLKIFKQLQDDRTSALDGFAHLKRSYERDGVAWYRERLGPLKANAARMLTWQANVWAEYLKTQQRLVLEMPEVRERLAQAA